MMETETFPPRSLALKYSQLLTGLDGCIHWLLQFGSEGVQSGQREGSVGPLGRWLGMVGIVIMTVESFKYIIGCMIENLKYTSRKTTHNHQHWREPEWVLKGVWKSQDANKTIKKTPSVYPEKLFMTKALLILSNSKRIILNNAFHYISLFYFILAFHWWAGSTIHSQYKYNLLS